MIFHYKQRNISAHIPEISIDGISIERVQDFNFLGLTIDENMSWKAHTQKIANKISRSLGVMSSLKNFLPRQILLTLYNWLIFPHNIQYYSGGLNLDELQVSKNGPFRLISRSKYNAHSEPIFKKTVIRKMPRMARPHVDRP